MFERESLTRLADLILWYHAEDMEVSLKLIANGGTIVYAPEAVVAHVPESGRARFWISALEMLEPMLEYCENILNVVRTRPDFDFIGGSTMVL